MINSIIFTTKSTIIPTHGVLHFNLMTSLTFAVDCDHFSNCKSHSIGFISNFEETFVFQAIITIFPQKSNIWLHAFDEDVGTSDKRCIVYLYIYDALVLSMEISMAYRLMECGHYTNHMARAQANRHNEHISSIHASATLIVSSLSHRNQERQRKTGTQHFW